VPQKIPLKTKIIKLYTYKDSVRTAQ